MAKKRKTSSGAAALIGSAINAFGAWKRKKPKTSSSTSGRFAFKGNGSRTKTKTKKRSSSARGQSSFGGSIVNFNMTCRPNRRDKDFYKTHIKNEDVENNGDRVQDVFGKQAVSTIYTNAGYLDVYRQYQACLSGAAAPKLQSGKVYLQSTTSKIMFTNQAPSNCELTLYFCVARKDINASGYSTPSAAWSYGMGLLDGGAAANINVIGVKPTDSLAFNTWWKIKKIDRHILANGESHNVLINHRANQWVQYERIINNLAFKGLTMCVMAVVTGFPENDLTNKTIVSSASTGVDYTWCERNIYYYGTNNYSSFGQNDALSTKAIVAESTMQEAVGIVNAATKA